MHLCQCAGGSVVSPRKKVGVYVLLFKFVLSVLTLKRFFFHMLEDINGGGRIKDTC